jgi:hypothetical protein
MAAVQDMTDASHEEMVAEITPPKDVETMACQGTEARQEDIEPTSLDRKPEVAQEEVPVESATIMPVREPRKRLKD